MSRCERSELESRISAALSLLVEGYAPASISRQLAADFNVSIRQARRYVSAAQLDYFDAPLTRNELELGVALQIDRLDLISDRARQADDLKGEIAAIKAGATLRENRLKALAREEEIQTRLSSNKNTFY